MIKEGMHVIQLKDINMKNFNQVISIQLSEEDKRMVAPNMYSLAEAYADKVSVPKAIYDKEELVGFIMYDYDKSFKIGYISRLMVGTNYQRRGYGKEAMIQVIAILKKIKRLKQIRLSYNPNNEKAKQLYKSLGFVETGNIDQGEMEAILNIRD